MTLNKRFPSNSQAEWNAIEVPEDRVKQAIHLGLKQAKQKRRSVKQQVITVVSIAALFILFFTSIRVSPTFASAVSSLPGMERIVAYIQGQNDRGLIAALENDAYQSLNVSQKVGNQILTIEGVIPDQNGMVIFYHFDSPKPIKFSTNKSPAVLYANGEILQAGYSFYNPEAQESELFEDVIQFHYQDAIPPDTSNYTLRLSLEDATFHLDFHLKKPLEPNQEILIDKEITLDDNTILLEKVTISPLRVGIQMRFPKTNPDTLYRMEDLKLIDETGDVWGTIQNGLSATTDEKNQMKTYYFQSNYYASPKKLTLHIGKVQALPNDDNYLLIDFDSYQVLHKPNVGDMKITVGKNDVISYSFPITSDSFHDVVLGATYVNGSEEPIYSSSEEYSSDTERHSYRVIYPPGKLKGTVRITFNSYPHYLKDSAEVEILK